MHSLLLVGALYNVFTIQHVRRRNKNNKGTKTKLKSLFLKCFCTSLYGAFLPLCACKGVDEVSKGTMAAEELLVGATLCDFAIYQDEDEVSLRQEARPMGDQDAGL